VASPAAASTISIRIYLAGRSRAAMAAYAAAVSDPVSRSYRKFLTPGQERARYGPTAAQVRAVTSWLAKAGLRVTGVTQHYVAVAGSVATAEAAFAVRLARFREPGGAVALAPEQDASVPAAIAPAVLTVSGLDTATVTLRPALQESARLESAQLESTQPDLPGPPAAFYRAGPCSKYYGQRIATAEPKAFGRHVPWGVCGYTPAQLRGAYGASASATGSGVTVAVIDAYAAPTMPRDVSTWARTVRGVPAFKPGQYRQVLPGKFDDENACGASGWYEEQTLDVEAVHTMAPAARVEYVAATDCTFGPLLDALTEVVDKHLADVVSDSWTGAEQGLTSADAAPFDQVFEQGAIEGIGFDFASGDCGYNDPSTQCGFADQSGELQVSFPTSSTWVTGVGGTSLAIGKRNNYEWEAGWGDMTVPLKRKHWTPLPPGHYPGDFDYGGGGGTSMLYEQPGYQAGAVPGSLANTLPSGKVSSVPMRVVPDVAMDADPSTGFLIGETVRLRSGKDGFMLSRIGGTSLATPLFAGLEADAAGAAGGELGFINPTLYAMAGSPAYHDVTSSPLGRGVRLALARNEWGDTAKGTGKVSTELFTLGTDGGGRAALTASRGFDDVTGLGSPAGRFVSELAAG
jgi:subtilase family serine protease